MNREAEWSRGLVHLYVGDGKGKSTAAAGLALRALGGGKTVYFCQFLKGGTSGELAPLARLGAVVDTQARVERFTFQMTDEERSACARRSGQALAACAQALAGGAYDLVVLDEGVDAANKGMVPWEALLQAVENRAPRVEVVLTGRKPDPRLEALADYYTQMVCQKHPYQEGIPARKGIEY